MDRRGEEAETAVTPPVSILPPYRVVNDFLDEASVEALLQMALAREAEFAPTKVGPGASAAAQTDA